jgi:hypothetical protein
MKNKIQIPHYRTVTVPISNRKIVDRGKIDTPNTQIHDRSLSWLGTGLVTIPLTHKYMTVHFPGLVHALQLKVAVLGD